MLTLTDAMSLVNNKNDKINTRSIYINIVYFWIVNCTDHYLTLLSINELVKTM
jgi:hypothetical protein